MTEKYYWERKNKLAPRYRLKRRGNEVIKIIKKYFPEKPQNILDIGSADGLMLSRIKKEFPESSCIGIKYAKELIGKNTDPNILIIQGDAQNLLFQDDTFDIAIATAIIEHLDRPMLMLKETKRILKKNGILILTTPNPIFEKVGEIIGKFSREEHQQAFNLKILEKYFRETGFEVAEKQMFMFSPVGFPLEIQIEKIIKFLGLKFLLLNQLIVGKK